MFKQITTFSAVSFWFITIIKKLKLIFCYQNKMRTLNALGLRKWSLWTQYNNGRLLFPYTKSAAANAVVAGAAGAAAAKTAKTTDCVCTFFVFPTIGTSARTHKEKERAREQKLRLCSFDTLAHYLQCIASVLSDILMWNWKSAKRNGGNRDQLKVGKVWLGNKIVGVFFLFKKVKKGRHSNNSEQKPKKMENICTNCVAHFKL